MFTCYNCRRKKHNIARDTLACTICNETYLCETCYRKLTTEEKFLFHDQHVNDKHISVNIA